MKKIKKLKLHLYVSEIPCGDASMGIEGENETELVKKREQKGVEKEQDKLGGYWSGAKTLNFEISKELGIPRLKSQRSDIPEDKRSVSMSCSDKICMWNVMGVAGCILSEEFDNNVLVIDSIIIECEHPSEANMKMIKRGILPKNRSKIEITDSLLPKQPEIILLKSKFEYSRHVLYKSSKKVQEKSGFEMYEKGEASPNSFVEIFGNDRVIHQELSKKSGIIANINIKHDKMVQARGGSVICNAKIIPDYLKKKNQNQEYKTHKIQAILQVFGGVWTDRDPQTGEPKGLKTKYINKM